MGKMERSARRGQPIPAGRAAISGFAWLMFQSGGSRVVSILTQLLLAKLLVPSQFGVISIVYMISTISAAIVNFGIDNVLLQRYRTVHLWLAASFWTSLGLSICGLAVVAVAATVLSGAYHLPQLPELSILLALSMPFGALTTIPAVKLRLDMNFKFPAIYGTLENLATQLASVVLAMLGFGV